MRLLLTGATGFLGSHIAEQFIAAGHQVRALTRPTSNTRFLQALGVECHTATLDQADALRAGMKKIDVVAHVAAKVHTFGFWRDFVHTTVRGTRNVLEAAIAAGVPHFIQLSSVGVYGRPRSDGQPFDENDSYGQPHRWNYYSRAKIEAEKLVRQAQSTGKIATTILRPTWIYGPRDSTTFDRLVAALKAGRLKWIGDTQNILSLVFVTDVATAVVLAATKPQARGQIFNVATDEPSVTQERFITLICDQLALAPPALRISYTMAHNIGFISECIAHATGYRLCPPINRLSVLLLGGQRRYRTNKLQSDLGWKPTVLFEEGLRATVEWYRSH